MPNERTKIGHKAPTPGFEYNPLVQFPRNEKCPCGSGVKFKKCHLPKIARAIPTEETLKKLKKQYDEKEQKLSDLPSEQLFETKDSA